jgi:hypothetical protein
MQPGNNAFDDSMDSQKPKDLSALDDLLAGARAIRCSLNPDPLLVRPEDLRELGGQVL